MRPLSEYKPGTLLVSMLAGLTTWVTLLAWSGFAERPAGFLVPILGACLLVAVVGMLLRSVRMPAVLVALAQVLVVLFWLHHRLASDTALGGLVPTPTSVRLMVATFHESGVAAQTYSSPVPASVPAFYPLLILAGSLTAVLVDLLAVGLRRAPLAGLPLLAVYTAPVSILGGGVSWFRFAAASLCFLFLIAAGEESRLAHWGHHLTPRQGLFDSQSTPHRGQALWSSARKIGFTTTALAVVAPLLVPTFSVSLFGGGGGKGDGTGNGVSVSNPMVDLKRDLTRGADIDLVKVATADPDPSYLRLTVLNSFDGNAWRPAGRDIPLTQRADGAVAAPPGLETNVTTRRFTSTLSVSDFFASRWLPTPYPVSSVQAPGDWRYDKSTLDFISAADGQTTAGLTYRVRSLTLSPTTAALANPVPAPLSVFAPNTALPRGFPAAVRRLARAVTRGKVTKFEQAVALQQWFRVGGGFRYSLKRPPGNSTGDLLTFLGTGRNGRVGYCEQFAAAMAVMGRSLGIPSRVAVGFLRPERTRTGTWVYSSHDLHAWPEMYFGGVGWVRFEPTPQGRTGEVPAYTAQQVPQTASSSGTATASAAPSGNRLHKRTDQAASAGAKTRRPGSTGSVLLGGSGGVMVLVLMLLAPRALRSLVRRRRWSEANGAGSYAEAAWGELRDTALDLAVAWDDHVTVRTAATRLERFLGNPAAPEEALSRGPRRGPEVNPKATLALRRLVLLLERARYARTLPAGTATVEETRADVATCVEALRAGAGRSGRARATWMPASVLSTTGARRRGAKRRGPLLGQPGVDRAV